MEPTRKRIKIKSLNPFITCYICGGYLIDATTVTECLHTFCKSCLIQHVEENNSCPKCEQLIHQSHPKNYISFDRSVQDIVNKLVPNLYSDELKRRKDFYASLGLAYDCSNETVFKDLDKTETKAVELPPEPESKPSLDEKSDYHRRDEQVSINLISYDTEAIISLKRAYLRCSTQATVTHLKKYLSSRLYSNIDRFKESEPLELRYKRHVDV